MCAPCFVPPNQYLLKITAASFNSLRDEVKPDYKGIKCDACHKLVWQVLSWRSEKDSLFKKRGKLFFSVFPSLNRDGDIFNPEHREHLNIISRTRGKFLTLYGRSMKNQVNHLIKRRETCIPTSLFSSNDFLSNDIWLTRNHPQYEEFIEVDILNHSVFKMRGRKTGRKLHLKEATKSLLCTIRSESGVTCRRFSDNLSNISERNMRKSAKALDGVIRKDAGGSIIDRTDEEAIVLVSKFIRGEYKNQKLDRTKHIEISLSIDATVV